MPPKMGDFLRIPTWNAVPGTGILANILAMLVEINDIGEGICTYTPIIGEDLAPKKVSSTKRPHTILFREAPGHNCNALAGAKRKLVE